jgi:beta-N-acetylhexosaminidase
MPAELRERIGQMVMVGFRGMNTSEAEPTMRAIEAGAVGAVVLYDIDAETGGPRNIQSRRQLRALTSGLKAAYHVPVLVAMDAEGGSYSRLKTKYGFSPGPAAAEVGERNFVAFTNETSVNIARQLAEVGVDMNLAPVVDLLSPANQTMAARRHFSSEPAAVATHAREFIVGHRTLGLLTALKHFPGLGGTATQDPGGPGELMDGWSSRELEPYKTLIHDRLVDAIMVSPAKYPQLDPDYPACLSSRIVGGLLRREMGYDGVVMSDAMEMQAVWEGFGFERGTILAVNAGVDLLFYCNQSGIVPYDDNRGLEVIEVVLAAIARGEIAESRVNEACGRVLALKSRLLS